MAQIVVLEFILVLCYDDCNGEDNMQLKTLLPEHASKVIALYDEMMAALPSADWFRPIKPTVWQTILSNPDIVVLGLWEGDELAALSSLHCNNNSYDHFEVFASLPQHAKAEIGFSFTATNHRGKGIMGLLVQALFDIASKRGVTHLIAAIHPDNAPSHHGVSKNCHLTLVGTYLQKGIYPRNVYIATLK